MAERSRSFAPTLLAGLAGAALAAVAAGRDWATATVSSTVSSAGAHTTAGAKGSGSAPLAIALALVALAAWGVVLVVRGRTRRVVAVVGALASTGVVVTTVASLGRVRTDAARAVQAQGALAPATHVSLTGWFVVCVVASLVTAAAFVVAVTASPRWPSMGSRYDAPATRASAAPEERDMWRALDEGRDPTQ